MFFVQRPIVALLALGSAFLLPACATADGAADESGKLAERGSMPLPSMGVDASGPQELDGPDSPTEAGPVMPERSEK